MKTNILFFFIISIILLSSCKKDCTNPYSSLKGKVKLISIDLSDSSRYNIYYTYDTLSAKVTNIKLFIKPPYADSFGLDAEYIFRYSNNTITIDEIGLDNVYIYHQYKVHFNNNKHIDAFNTIDVNFNTENPYITCILQNNKLDSFYEKQYWPTAFNRQCYNYQFNGYNYTGFTFEYDWSTIGAGSVHVLDSAKIDYTNLPYTPYAPMQNMYSANTLFNLGSPGEVFYDLVYFLGLEGYSFYEPNKNLVNYIHSYHDSTTIVYMDYQFNSSNQLKTFDVHFRTPTFKFFTYNFEYY